MNRMIIFRGQRKDTKDWVYGDLEHFDDGEIHIFGIHYSQPVIKSTIGQFTGFYDRDQTAIYEGDICTIHNAVKAEVIWQSGGFHLLETTEDVNGRHTEYCFSAVNKIKVIGNIHDKNSDL